MKKIIYFFFAISILFLLQNCDPFGHDDDPQYTKYSPVILKRVVFENTTSLEAPRSVINSGKIYVYDQFLFINEPNEGFHVYDNSNPENPVNMAFIKVLGSSDLTIKNDVLYINNATDLIAVKPNADFSSIEITKRIPYTFPQMVSPDGYDVNFLLQYNEIIVNWALIQ